MSRKDALADVARARATVEDAETESNSRIAPARKGPDMSDRVRATMQRFLDGEMEMPDEHDAFYIDPSKIPDGTTYEWKRGTVFGKEDRTYAATLEGGGWSPVEAARHPEMMARDHSGYIERDGMILMERPSIITDHVRARDTRASRELIRIKEAEAKGTPDGTLPRDEPALRAVAKGFRKSYAPIQAEIPAD